MIGQIIRTLVFVFVTLGILAPHSAGMVTALGLADGRVMVICTSDGLRTIRINDDGEPVEVSETAEHCALVHAVETASGVAPTPVAEKLLFFNAPVLPVATDYVALVHRPSFPRAPPAI